MLVAQCWDDGIVSDIRLAEILRRYDAKATFNLNAGLHDTKRSNGWRYQDTWVERLARSELEPVYQGFTIANHSLTHPHLPALTLKEINKEVGVNRQILQDWFQQPVLGFVYPFGTYDHRVKQAVRTGGHLYARSVKAEEFSFPPADPMEFHPTCHFLAADFWGAYEKAKQSGIFYFWGHSYELLTEAMWDDFETKIRRINDDQDATWVDVPDLFNSTIN